MKRPLIHDIFRERVLQVLARTGMSYAAFARKAGLDRSTLSQLLTGPMPRLPRAETLAAIARSAHVSTKAARRLLKRLLTKQGCAPRCMITDKLGSYAAARRQILPTIEHRSHKGLNNRAENSHLPLRRRERAMQGFRSPGGLQRFVTVFSAVRNHFVPTPPLRPCHPCASSQRHGAMEGRGPHRRLITLLRPRWSPGLPVG